MARQVSLDEAKKVLAPSWRQYSRDKITVNGNYIFENDRGRFNIADFGRMSTHMTFTVPDIFQTDDSGDLKSPLQFYSSENSRYLMEHLGIDFKAGETPYGEIMGGNFRLSRAGKPTFELKELDRAKDLLIHMRCFDGVGLTKDDVQEAGALHYSRAGDDDVYIVIPVDYKGWTGDRPMADVLKECQDEIDAAQKKEDDRYESRLNAKAYTMEKAQPILDEIRRYDKDYKCEFNDIFVHVSSPADWFAETYYYGEGDGKFIEHLNKDLQYFKDRADEKALLESYGFDTKIFDEDQRNILAGLLKEGYPKEDVECIAFPHLEAYVIQDIDFDNPATWLPNTDVQNQMDFYAAALRSGRPVAQIKLCAEHDLGRHEADAVFEEIDNGIPPEKAALMADKDYSTYQIHEIANWIREGIPQKKIDRYLTPSRSSSCMKQVRLGIKDGLSDREIDFYAEKRPMYFGRRYEERISELSEGKMISLREQITEKRQKLIEHGIDPSKMSPRQAFAVYDAIDAGMSEDKVRVLTADRYLKNDLDPYGQMDIQAVTELLNTDITAGDAEYILQNYNQNKTEHLTSAIKDGVPLDGVIKAGAPEFDESQTDEILRGYKEHLSDKEIDYYARPECCAREMHDIREAVMAKDPNMLARIDGYPEYQCYNRLSGATNLSHAYVIESDGTVRAPDSNALRNSNHRFHYNSEESCIKFADGRQSWQLRPGEAVVKYEKAYTRDPYHISFEWRDGKLTDAQKETITGCLGKLLATGFPVVGRDGSEVRDIREWMSSSDFTPEQEYLRDPVSDRFDEETDNTSYEDPVSALIEEARASADAHNADIKQSPVNRDSVQIGD